MSSEPQPCPFCGAVPKRAAEKSTVWIVHHYSRCYLCLVTDENDRIELWGEGSDMWKSWQVRTPDNTSDIATPPAIR